MTLENNRLVHCIDEHLSELNSDDMSEATATMLQDILRPQLVQESEQKIEEWLQRVSKTFVIEYAFLKRDFDKFIRFAQKNKRVDDDKMAMEMDTAADDNETHSKRSKTKPAVTVTPLPKIITRWQPSIGRFVHEATGMVFISQEDPRVFGRWDGNDDDTTIHPLTEEDIQVCNFHRFYYTTLLSDF